MADFDVSYVVTVYNKAPFIPGMIDSLRRQCGNLRAEYIFVDDGSSDGSADRVAEATRGIENVTVLRQGNAGPAVATNVGVRHARGRYVKLLDADDLLVAGITPLMCDELTRRGSDLIIGRLGTYRLGAAVGNATPVVPAALGAVSALVDPLHTVIATGISNTSGTLFRRAAFVEAGGCDETVFVQDFSFFLRMARRGRYLVSDAVVALIPETVEGRVSDMQGQALHDTNRALFNFVSADRDLPARYRRLAMRRAAGRAWKWAHRHRGASILSKPFWIHAVSRLPIAGLARWVLRNACRPFYADAKLRFMSPRI